MKINLYDFDETIYDGDSTVDFIKYEIINHPIVLLNIPRVLIASILYLLHIINKTKFKENLYRFLVYIDDIDTEVISFWKTHEKNIKDFYKNRDHSNDIIISASPEFLLKPISKKLKVKDLIASRVNSKNGKTKGLNCHDVEKVRRLNEKYSNYNVISSYSDSIKSDYPILKLAKNAYIVKKDKLIHTDIKKLSKYNK